MARYKRATTALRRGWLEIGGVRRTYLLAVAPQAEAPLLIVLHGLGTAGKDMEAFSCR